MKKPRFSKQVLFEYIARRQSELLKEIKEHPTSAEYLWCHVNALETVKKEFA